MGSSASAPSRDAAWEASATAAPDTSIYVAVEETPLVKAEAALSPKESLSFPEPVKPVQAAVGVPVSTAAGIAVPVAAANDRYYNDGWFTRGGRINKFFSERKAVVVCLCTALFLVGVAIPLLLSICCGGRHGPEKDGPAIVLVPADSPRAVKFAHADALAQGERAPLVFASHPGVGLTPTTRIEGPFDLGEDTWEVVELGPGPDHKAIMARLEGGFLELELPGAGREFVADVSWWSYVAENTVNAIRSAKDPSRTYLRDDEGAGGRTFELNEDGTISCKSAPGLVLGISMPKIVLVDRHSPLRIAFKNTDALRAGEDTPLVLDGPFHDFGVVQMYDEARELEIEEDAWSYIELGVGPADKAISAFHKDPHFLVRAPTDEDPTTKALDISFWRIAPGSGLSFVSGRTDARTFLEGGGRDFTVTEDGLIASTKDDHLVLGMSFDPHHCHHHGKGPHHGGRHGDMDGGRPLFGDRDGDSSSGSDSDSDLEDLQFVPAGGAGSGSDSSSGEESGWESEREGEGMGGHHEGEGEGHHGGKGKGHGKGKHHGRDD